MKPSAEEINNHYFNHKEALKSVKPLVDTHSSKPTLSKSPLYNTGTRRKRS